MKFHYRQLMSKLHMTYNLKIIITPPTLHFIKNKFHYLKIGNKSI